MADARKDLIEAAHRIHRRASLVEFLRRAGVYTTAALFVSGTLVLLLRFLADMPRVQAAWVLAIALTGPLVAWWVARGRGLSEDAAATWLDVRSGASGLLVTALEMPDERWARQTRETLALAPAPPAANLSRVWTPVVPALVFAVLALWIEVPVETPGPPTALFESTLEELREKLETLEEIVELDEETASELSTGIESLDDEYSDARSETTFEALDELSDRLSAEALEAAEAARDGIESLALAQREALMEQHSPGAELETSRAQERLEEALAELSEDGLASELPESLDELLGMQGSLELPENMELSPGETLALSSELQSLLEGKLEKLRASGLLEGDSARALTEAELEALRNFDYSEFEERPEGEPGGT